MDYYEYPEEELIEMIKSGKVIIYPTDTVYGIGCNALNESSVARIKLIKAREKEKPLSVIAPSKEWIKENLITDKVDIDKYLPGPYTLVLWKKDKTFLYNVSQSDTLGIRIPDNDFTKLVAKAGVPFITTSVNLSGEKPASSFFEIKTEILESVDIALDGGTLAGTPSTIIMPNGEELKR
ncbi:MAG: L-threonylcarbamoyladenylate synthase [archaeon]|jgi:L-threonylcarbamoyladenylate synthase|nr:L-threonylcarbamoyladenylate synthase [archaeon]